MEQYIKLIDECAGNKDEVFGRRSSIQRTPSSDRQTQTSVSAETAPTMRSAKSKTLQTSPTMTVSTWEGNDGKEDARNMSVINWCRDGEAEGRDRKNAREDRSGDLERAKDMEEEQGAREIRELRRIIDKLGQSSKTLRTLVGGNPNTKIGIKSETKVIARLVEGVTKRMEELEVQLRKREKVHRRMTVGKEIATQSDLPQRNGGGKIDRAVQTEMGDVEITGILDKAESFDDLAAVLDRPWREGVYERVRVV